MGIEPSVELLRRLTLAAGVPGAEDDVRAIVREQLEGVGTVSFDRTGSILCESPGPEGGPRVLLGSHLDEVGFLVQSVTADGHIALAPMGGWWGHVLLGQRVVIATGAGSVPGVIGSKPPHFLKPDERTRVLPLDEMYVDIGASTPDEAAALGVRVGDPIAPHGEWIEFAAQGVLSSKAFDNRVGVGLMCETMRALAGRKRVNTVVGVGTAQEELGARGARTATAQADPDVAIVLEATPADDAPGNARRQAILGAGPQIRMHDPTATANRRLVAQVERAAEGLGIEIQRAVRTSGGTDAKEIHLHGRGVPAVVIGVPARYIHAHVGLIQWTDYAEALDLVVSTIDALDAATVRGLVEFG